MLQNLSAQNQSISNRQQYRPALGLLPKAPGAFPLSYSSSAPASIRFGSETPAGPNSDELPAAHQDILTKATDLHAALKTVDVTNPDVFRKAVDLMLNGDEGLAERLMKAIQGFRNDIALRRSCEPVHGTSGNLVGHKIVSGSFEKVFTKRTGLFPGDKFTFDQFLTHPSVLGDKRRVVIALTGWTKPPTHYLKQNPELERKMKELPPEQWPAFAEKFYVQVIKDYLEQVFNRLKENDKDIADKIAFIYGVTPQGVDRAIEEFCDKNRIRYAGVTCYDWAPYLDDVSGKRPLYLAKDPKEFGKIMSDCSDKVVVVGGRAFASAVTENGDKIGKGPNPVVPIDLMEMHDIVIPGVVVSELDRSSSRVENAAAVLKGNRETNPENFPEVVSAVNKDDDPKEVFILYQILRKLIKKLELVRRTEDSA